MFTDNTGRTIFNWFKIKLRRKLKKGLKMEWRLSKVLQGPYKSSSGKPEMIYMHVSHSKLKTMYVALGTISLMHLCNT